MVEKHKKFNIELQTIEIKNQNYFRFEEINLKGKGQQAYIASYEDLAYLNETVTFKNKNIVLPQEEELLEKPELLQKYLQQIEENAEQEEFEQFLQES